MTAAPTPAVILRADGGPTIGGGHIARAKIISDALLSDGFDVHLLTKDTDWMREAKGRFACKIHFLRKTDNESLIVFQAAKKLDARLTILDVQDNSPEYVRYLQETGAPVVTIDDLGRGADAADATFRGGTAFRREKNYYYGMPYAILSPKILELRRQSAAPAGVRSAVVFLGTFDPRGHAKWILALAERFPQISFQWFTSDAQPPKPNLQPTRPSQDVFLENLATADIAIIAGGVTLFEAAALGRPAIVLPQAPHEEDQAELFSAAGSAIVLPAPTAEDIAGTVSSLVQSPRRLSGMSARGMECVDGRGLDRFREVVRNLTARVKSHAG